MSQLYADYMQHHVLKVIKLCNYEHTQQHQSLLSVCDQLIESVQAGEQSASLIELVKQVSLNRKT